MVFIYKCFKNYIELMMLKKTGFLLINFFFLVAHSKYYFVTIYGYITFGGDDKIINV